MLSTFARLLLPNTEDFIAIEKAALVINIRERHFLSDFPDELRRLQKKKLEPYVLFFEASDEVLQRRFSETRRPHPADNGKGLLAAIRAERKAMDEVRRLSDLIIDTSEHTVHSLRHLLVQKFSQRSDGSPLRVQIISFGHKYGVPGQIDLLFDVRHLPNPYFEKGLRELTGNDKKVIRFLESQEEVLETSNRFTDLLKYLLPLYKREGKSYLTIGVGCTGGRHRSVMIANRLARSLKSNDLEISVLHRDIQK
jgi:UPF0042 nucleotide-binding protein